MSDEMRTPVREICAHALELKDPQERERYLAQACGQDSQLRQQVDAWLTAQQEPGGALENGWISSSRSAMPFSMPTRRESFQCYQKR